MTATATIQGYRRSRSDLGGLHNGYATPRRTQEWNPGEMVKVGFLTLEVVERVGGEYRLWNPSTGKKYVFVPHMGLHSGWEA